MKPYFQCTNPMMLMIAEMLTNIGDHISCIFQKWPDINLFSVIPRAYIGHFLNASHCLGTEEKIQDRSGPCPEGLGSSWGRHG